MRVYIPLDVRFRNLSMFWLEGHFCLKVFGDVVICNREYAEPSSAPELFGAFVKRSLLPLPNLHNTSGKPLPSLYMALHSLQVRLTNLGNQGSVLTKLGSRKLEDVTDIENEG